jgi:pimeloyl-ACP methyl ester carboxylesterase
MPEEHEDDTIPQRVRLSDGRWLGYRELGDPGGAPLFFFHGTPGSRWSVDVNDPLARMPGVRLILPERPGYGLSTAKPDRRLLDRARDVAELADQLGIGEFAVAGVSGGGPHALACAAALPDRVTVAVILSSPAPADFPGATRGMSFGNRIGLWLQRFAPGLFRRVMAGNAAAFHRDPQRFLDALAAGMSVSDREINGAP